LIAQIQGRQLERLNQEREINKQLQVLERARGIEAGRQALCRLILKIKQRVIISFHVREYA